MIKSYIKSGEFFIFLLLIFLCFALTVLGNFSYAVLDGISLWAACILPSLFPYLFITFILSSLNITYSISNKLTPIARRLFGVGGNVLYAFFLSVISGYPIGAKTVSELRENNLISQTESVRGSALCSTSSPTFLITSVGTFMFNDKTFGCLLFLTHIISVMLIGIIFSFYKKKDKRNITLSHIPKRNVDNLFYNGVYSSVISVLTVGGMITIFYLVIEILLTTNLLSPLISAFSLIFKEEELASGVVLGTLECTRGMKALSSLPLKTALPFCALLSGFGGVSVIMQSITYLKRAKIKTAPFLISKILCAVISFFIGLIFSLLL